MRRRFRPLVFPFSTPPYTPPPNLLLTFDSQTRSPSSQITSDSEDIDNSDSNLTPAQKKKKTLEKLAMKKRKEMAKAYQPDDDDDSDSDLDREGFVPRRKTGGGGKTPAGPPILGLRMDCGDCGNQFSYVRPPPPVFSLLALLISDVWLALCSALSPSIRLLRHWSRTCTSVTSAPRRPDLRTTRVPRLRPRRRPNDDRCVTLRPSLPSQTFA